MMNHMAGRFAPSPSGALHLGNLRTALVAWLAARASGREFFVRIDDLDAATSNVEHERSQLRDLAVLGLDWDGEIVHQSNRFDRYREVISGLIEQGWVYECYCTRREIRHEIEQAVRAPHVHLPDGAYPGTCRDLSDDERRERVSTGRHPALRLRTDGESLTFIDRLAGRYVGQVDDLVLARADGTPAYNLAVVVDDHDQSVDQVVRGADLLASTPRQMLLYERLGWAPPEYLHVPLVMADATTRLAKRDGPVTLDGLRAHGLSTDDLTGLLAHSLGLATVGERVTAAALVDRFDVELIPRQSVLVDDLLVGGPHDEKSV